MKALIRSVAEEYRNLRDLSRGSSSASSRSTCLGLSAHVALSQRKTYLLIGIGYRLSVLSSGAPLMQQRKQQEHVCAYRLSAHVARNITTYFSTS